LGLANKIVHSLGSALLGHRNEWLSVLIRVSLPVAASRQVLFNIFRRVGLKIFTPDIRIVELGKIDFDDIAPKSKASGANSIAGFIVDPFCCRGIWTQQRLYFATFA